MSNYTSIKATDCEITIEPRPHYCDRGNFLAKVFRTINSNLARDLDSQDGWPRYYFDKNRAIAECVAWLNKRGLANKLVIEEMAE